MKILFAASEAVPFMKTGGLADVTGSLPGYLYDLYYKAGVNIERQRVASPFLCESQLAETVRRHL